MTTKIKSLLNEVDELFGCVAELEYKGETVKTLLEDIESHSPEVNVFWGCWNETELGTII